MSVDDFGTPRELLGPTIPPPTATTPPVLAYSRSGRRPGVPAPTHSQWDAFLEALSVSGNQASAARIAGVGYMTVQMRKRSDPDFAEAVAITLAESGHALLEVARQRAIDKSDPLMAKLLDAYLPEMFAKTPPPSAQTNPALRIELSIEDRKALAPIKRRLLLGSAPGFYDYTDEALDAEWAEALPSTEPTTPDFTDTGLTSETPRG